MPEGIFNITQEEEDNEFDDKEIFGEEENEITDDHSLPGTREQRIFDRKWGMLKKHLFNVEEDPEERKDLVESHPEVLEKLRRRAREYLGSFVKRDYPDPSQRGNPHHFANVWSPGWCD